MKQMSWILKRNDLVHGAHGAWYMVISAWTDHDVLELRYISRSIISFNNNNKNTKFKQNSRIEQLHLFSLIELE